MNVEQTVSPMRKIWLFVEFEEALRRCIKASQRKDRDGIHYYLNRAAALYLGLDEDMTRATVPEASTETLIKELRRRARAEGDENAAQALKIKKPRKEPARV